MLPGHGLGTALGLSLVTEAKKRAEVGRLVARLGQWACPGQVGRREDVGEL